MRLKSRKNLRSAATNLKFTDSRKKMCSKLYSVNNETRPGLSLFHFKPVSAEM